MPTVSMGAPRPVTMNIGSRLWISSDEMSMNIEPNPNARMPVGKARHAAGVAFGRAPFEGGELICSRGPGEDSRLRSFSGERRCAAAESVQHSHADQRPWLAKWAPLATCVQVKSVPSSTVAPSTPYASLAR